MTDRINYLTVALEENMRDDDVEGLIAAIRWLRGVLSVASNVVNVSDWVSDGRAKMELRQKLWDVLKDDLK